MNGRSARRGTRLAVWLCAAVASIPGPAQTQPAEITPLSTELVEKTGVALTLLEVEVRDKQGRPIPGLTKEDFTVILNGRARPIYSLDDMCPADADPVSTPPAAPPDRQASDSIETALAVNETRKFILFFDFSQFQMDGRINALNAGEHWLREVMAAEDQAQIVAYTSMHGLQKLSEFREDREVQLAAIEAARNDGSLFDPFPTLASSRISCCLRGRCLDLKPNCKAWAWEAYRHNRHGMHALRMYLVGLETVPGRKGLILFQQDGSIFPSRRYGIDEASVGDIVQEMDEIGAEANLSRTAIYAVQSGDILSASYNDAVNFGANLADFTGGAYLRGTELGGFLARAGRESRCTYLIGIQRPPARFERIYRAKVLVRDQVLPGRFRVKFLDSVDRWWRSAQAVLSSPERATDVRLVAAAVPVAAAGKSWDVRLQVALDVESLSTIPRAGVQQADWEVGALLSHSRDGRAWEMLGVSRVRTRDEIRAPAFVVHEHSLQALSAGSYRLGAFARDRTDNLFGGAAADLVLPDPRKPGLAGPLLMLAEREYMGAALPLLKKKPESEAPTQARGRTGPIPADSPVREGELLTVMTWVCGGATEAPDPGRLLRYVMREDEALFRFERARLEHAGQCYKLSDTIDSGALGIGSYIYHVSWRRTGEEEPIESSLAFRIEPDPDSVPADLLQRAR